MGWAGLAAGGSLTAVPVWRVPAGAAGGTPGRLRAGRRLAAGVPPGRRRGPPRTHRHSRPPPTAAAALWSGLPPGAQVLHWEGRGLLSDCWALVWQSPGGGIWSGGRVYSRTGRDLKGAGVGLLEAQFRGVEIWRRLQGLLLLADVSASRPRFCAHRWEQVVDLTYSHRLGSRPQPAEAYTEAVQRLL